MLSLTDRLTRAFSAAFEKAGCPPEHGQVVESQRPDLCQFQCNGALAAAKAARRNPREVGQAVLDALEEKELFESLSLAGPGFINIRLKPGFLARHVAEMGADAALGCPPLSPREKVVVDFGGPNVAKSMHVGHLRSTILGDSLQRLFRFLGQAVVSDIHLGDWGTQMGMLIVALSRSQPGLPYFDAAFPGPYPAQAPVSVADLEEMYPRASALCKEDPAEAERARQATFELQQGRPGYRALWRHFVEVSVAAAREDFSALGVDFDLWLGESHYQDAIPGMIDELKRAGVARPSEGALVVPVDQEGGIPPLLLVKSDGGYLYGTTDLATLRERALEQRASLVLYVVDKRQGLHFEQVFRAAAKAGYLERCRGEHVAYGTVNGPDGKPFKTRSGGVMKLKDLIRMAQDEALKAMRELGVAGEYPPEEQAGIARKVGIAALKYADLMNHRGSDYVFDLAKFTRFEGRTGPYHLYAAVRVKSILRKAAEAGLEPGELLPATGREEGLMMALALFPDAAREAHRHRAPNHLCEHAFRLAQAFSGFYQQCHILGEQDPALRASWLQLARICLAQLEKVLELLGIETPERM